MDIANKVHMNQKQDFTTVTNSALKGKPYSEVNATTANRFEVLISTEEEDSLDFVENIDQNESFPNKKIS